MCEHCRSGKIWEEDKEEDVCEWSNPAPLEDEDELPPMCPNPATRVVWDRHVEDHLCDEHVDQENVDLDRGVGDLHRSLAFSNRSTICQYGTPSALAAAISATLFRVDL